MDHNGDMPFERPPLRDSGLLPAPGGHLVYWEESGAPDGLAALYLHGGPGGGLGTGNYRSKFDPQRFRIVGLDQRGCGRSTPSAAAPGYDLAENTTAHLLADIERLREHLGIDRWVVNGASWGSTLALAYAQAHPDRVLGAVLLAVTTTRRAEVDWITDGVKAIFPEDWLRYARHALADLSDEDLLAGRYPGRVVEAYAELMTDPDPAVRDAASHAWAEWEDVHISIGTGTRDRDPRWSDERFRHSFVTLTSHYWANDGFCDPPLLDRMDVLHGTPGILIHGRRDVSGPVVTAWLAHRRWPGSELIIDEREGHGGVAMVEAWVDANSRLADRLR